MNTEDAIIFIGTTASFAAVTVGCAAGVRFMTRRNGLAIVVGGLATPVLSMLGLLFFLSDMDVDGPPPGMVIGGTLTAVAIMMPLMMLISFLTVRWLARRENLPVD